ncbi:Conserved_hypothetical protein [Hexamita inflata]|uniref:BEACH domain-containing protein n=1 Tax=Hexamita inflata TaxID=28002 RepID=A0AA86PGY1_9EUKA|nr:Conserved hypothetical protein [Hexamita inflata]
MKRRVCLDEAIRQQISKQFNQDEVSEQLYKLSNAPYFRGAFELSLLKNKQELLEYLSEYPDTMLNEQGILADIYTNDLVIDEISINTNLLTQMQKLQPYQLILPFEYENKYYTFAQPAPLGQLLRYSPECLTSQLKLSLITDAAHLINTFHQVNQSYGSDFNIENSYVNLKTGTLKIAFPQLTSSKQPVNQNVTHLWITNQITNFQYIKYLNLLSGRRHSVFHSPFYPWVWDFNKNELRDPNQTQYYVNKGGQQIDFMFQSQALDASDTLSHTLSQYLNLISSPFDVKIAEPHHVGGPGVTELTLFCYLARRTPLKLLKKYVRPRFVAKQYCETIQSLHSWTPEEICAEYYTDYRVFTTDFQEFKTDPEFEHIFNSENILKNVELNGMTAKDFVTWHLDQLNSYPLLHNWLDLVFGPQHSGIRAFSCGNQPMSQTLQPFGMLNESYKMFTETHPIKLQDIDYLKDNKIHSVVTIDGNIRKDSQVNDDFDPLLQAHIMRQTKIQSQFSILTSFVPRFASQMSKLGYQYSLDRIYLCQFIFQIMFSTWCVKQTCFLDCMDELLCNEQDLVLNLPLIEENSSEIMELICGLFSKCYKNEKITSQELSKFQIFQQQYDVADLKQEVYKIRNFSSENKIIQLKKLQKFVKSEQTQSVLDQAVVELIQDLSDSQIKSLHLGKDQFIVQTLDRVFNNKDTVYYERLIDTIRADATFDSLLFEADSSYIEHQIKDTLSFCPICLSKIDPISIFVSKQVKQMYECNVVRQKMINQILYGNYVHYTSVKELYLKCVHSMSTFTLLNKTKMSTSVGILNFFPVGMKLVLDNMYSNEQVLNPDFQEVIDDLTYFLLQLNDQQMTSSILEQVLICLCSISDHFSDYFFNSSKLSNKNQVPKILNYQKIMQISHIICQNLLNPIVQVMQQDQCDQLFQKLLFPIFIQRFNFLISYIKLIKFNPADDMDERDIEEVSYPVLQLLNILSEITPFCSIRIVEFFFSNLVWISADSLPSHCLFKQLIKYEEDKDYDIITTQQLETFPILFLLLLKPFKQYATYQLILLIMNNMARSFRIQNSHEIYAKVVSYCILTCPRKVVQELERLTQVRVIDVYDALHEIFKVDDDEQLFQNIHFQEAAQDIELNTNTLAQTEYFKHLRKIIFEISGKEVMVTQGANYCDQIMAKLQAQNSQIVKSDWLSTSISFDKMSTQLIAKLQKQFKLTQELDSFIKDYQSTKSKYHMFSKFMHKIPHSVEKTANFTYLDELLNFFADNMQLLEQSDRSSFGSNSLQAGYTEITAVNFTNQIKRPKNPKNQQKNPQLFEVFDVINADQALSGPASIQKLNSSNYLVHCNRNIQIMNSSLIGHQQKSPLTMDVRYSFRDKVSAVSPGQTGQVFISTHLGEVLLFDLHKNTVVHTLQDQKAQVQLYQHVTPTTSEYLAAGLQPFLQKQSAYSPTAMSYDARLNLVAGATAQQIFLYDSRMRQGVVQSFSMNQQKFIRSQSLFSVPLQIQQLKLNNSKIFIGSNQFVDELDLRNLSSKQIFTHQLPFVVNFNSIGATIMQSDYFYHQFHPDMSETPFTSRLSRLVQGGIQPTLKTSVLTQNNLSLFSQEGSKMYINQIDLKSLLQKQVMAERIQVQSGASQSIYGGVRENVFGQEVKCAEYDEVLGCYLTLFSNGQVGVVK